MTAPILLLALILRLIFINQSLWLDESIEALALMGKMGPIFSYALSDFQPPLYHLIGIFWTRLFGFSEIALRLPSLISGLLTVFFVIKLAQMLFGKRVSIIAGFLTATNPLLIYYSQEGRTYAMTTFFITASFYFLFKLLKNKNISILHSTFYVLLTIGALWTSYLAWVVIALQALYLLFKKEYRILFFTLFSFASLLLWIPSLLKSLNIGLSDARNIPNWGRVVGDMSLKALGLTWVKLVIGRISFANKYLYAGIVVLLAFLHSLVFKRLRPFSKSHSLICFWLLSVPLVAIISLFIPIYSYFRVLFIVPAYFLLLSVALAKFPSPAPTMFILTSQLIFLSLFWFTPRFHREDWRSLTDNLNTQKEILVALPSLKVSAPLVYYGLTQPLVDLSLASLNTDQPVYYIRYAETIFDLGLQGHANLVSSGYTMTGEQVYPGITLNIYEKK